MENQAQIHRNEGDYLSEQTAKLSGEFLIISWCR